MIPKAALVYLFYKHDSREGWLIDSLNEMYDNLLSVHFSYPVYIFHHASLDNKIVNRIKSAIHSSIDLRFVEIEIEAPDHIHEVFQDHISWDGSRTWGIDDCHAYKWKSGPIYREESLSEFDYIMFIDTDAYISSPPSVDPFVRMQNENYKFGYRMISRDDWRITKFMWETYSWFSLTTKSKPKSEFGDQAKSYDYDMDEIRYYSWPEDKVSYYTNWWIMDMSFGNSFEYQSLFQAFEDTGGFYLNRWGDCPIKYLIINHCIDTKTEAYRFEDFDYRHAGHIVEANGNDYFVY